MGENMKKLELETRSLALLREMSQEYCIHTTSIKSILSELDDRLTRLEQTIQPVYKKTGILQVKQEDIVGILDKLDYVIEYYSVTNEVDETIRAGPANQLDAYMRCLRKLKSAIQYFSQNNPGSPEYMNVDALYKYGCDAVEKEFKMTLQRFSSPTAPIALLDMIDDDAGNTITMPHDKVEDLRIMCDWLFSCRNENLIDIYADNRSDFISKSLRSLQDYRSINMSSATSSTVSGPASSGRSSLSSPDLAVNKKRKAPKMAFKLSTCSVDETSITEQEIMSYLTRVKAFHKLAVNELNLMSDIIVADLRTPIYNRLIQESLKLISTDANNLTMRVKKSISRHDYKSALSLLPILRHQTLRNHNFDLLFDGCQSEPLDRFRGLTVIFQATISKSLEEFASHVRSDSDMKLPRDGTVHELTNNVMILIEQLREYLDIISSVIPVKDMQAMEMTTDKNRLGFGQYVTRLLGYLGTTIHEKAECYKSTNLYLVFLFKLNNYNYILKRLRSSDLLEIVIAYNQNVEDIYKGLIQDARDEYLRCLGPVVNHLRELQDSKKAIKDRFAGFNKDFQELHRLNRSYAVPDGELRNELRAAVKEEILQYYCRFHEFHMQQEFSKNKRKYAKYTPEQIGAMIDQFFESN